MGRHHKRIITTEGIDRRESGYYSTPQFIADFISEELIRLNPKGTYVLDPCVGKEEMLSVFYENNKQIDGFDIKDFGIHFKANFEQKDFLKYYIERLETCILGQKLQLHYDYYIANPPYNCHETDYIRNNKKKLKKNFPDVGVSNMYSMFLSAMIDLAQQGAVIGIITYDSFLNSRIHQHLRQQIINDCSISHLLLCPTDLFWEQKADVRTCILLLQKGVKQNQEVVTLNRTKNTDEFKEHLIKRNFVSEKYSNLVLTSELDRNEFIIGCPENIQGLFHNPRLGQLFRCYTGISTGDDKKYISKIKNQKYPIPFYKNPGSRRFYMEPDGFLINNFLELDKNIKNFMVRNKDILMTEGISCSSMGVPFGACYRPKSSTVGVNANIYCDNEEDIWWLMSYLNSRLVTFIVRGVLLRTNMITSGYVSRIPIIEFNKLERKKLTVLSKHAYESKIGKREYGTIINEIDKIVFNNIKLPKDVEHQVIEFSNNLLIST